MLDLFSDQFNFFRTEPYSVKKINLPDADILLVNSFFNESESNFYYSELFRKINWRQDQIKFYGKQINLPRLTAWYGENDKNYTYSCIPMKPISWTPELILIKQKIELIHELKFNSVLLNLYRNGSDSVAWHSDDEKELGENPVIGSVSFGETRIFQLRHKYIKNIKENIPLTHGSFLLMKGLTQNCWQHQIPKSSKQMRPRINLTFRIIE